MNCSEFSVTGREKALVSSSVPAAALVYGKDGLLYPYSALFVIWFARYRVECALRHLIRIGLNEVKGHEHLARCNDFCNAKFEIVYAATTRYHGDAFVRLQPECFGILGIHLQPCIRRHSLQNPDLTSLRARMPVFDRSSGIENEWELPIGLLREWFPFNRKQLCLAIISLEFTIRVEARGFHRTGIFGEWPLHAAVLFNQVVSHPRVVAESSGGDA